MQAKGGSFGLGADRELYKFTLGEHTAIPAVEEAVASMKPGGIRRLIVPVELGYPDNDFRKKGPKPTTFSVPPPPSHPCRRVLQVPADGAYPSCE